MEEFIKAVKALAEADLLLIDDGDTFAECDMEIHRKKNSQGKEVVLFVVKERVAG